MPAELTWDMLNLTYDSSAFWDGTAAPRKKAMSHIKAIINFSNYTAPQLGPAAQSIHDKMLLNAVTFAEPSVSMANLQTLITTYDQKLVARASRASADVLAFNEARDALEDALGKLGNYVNTIADGDAVIVEKSGFPSYDTTHAPDPSPPAAPTNASVKHGTLSGSVVMRFKPDRSGSVNEVQANTGDPNVEADWHTKGIFKGGRAKMSGFTPGAMLWLRARTTGSQGVMGAWSDPVCIRVV